MRKTALFMSYLYFFICPLEFILNRYFGSSVKYIALVAAAFILMYFIGTRSQKMKIGAIQISIVLWAVFEAASLLWTLKTDNTVNMLITYLMMAVLVFAMSIFPYEQKEYQNILLSYTLGCFVLSILLLALGEPDEGSIYSGRLTLYILGKYQDPNELAAILLSGIFFSLHKALSKPQKSIFPNILYGIMFLVTSIAIFITGSRGALLAYGAALAIYVFISIPAKNRWRLILSLPIIFVLAYFTLRLTLSEVTFNRLFDFTSYSGGNGRIKIWTTALLQILKRPLFGNGILSHSAYFDTVLGNKVAMHNTPLFLLFEVGIVGLCLFMLPFVKSGIIALKRKNPMIIAVLTASLIACLFIDSLNVRYLWNAMMFGVAYYNCKTVDLHPQSVHNADNTVRLK